MCVPFRHDLYMRVVLKEMSPYLSLVSFVVKLLTLLCTMFEKCVNFHTVAVCLY
jgi:hypothetical protein